MTLMKLCGCMFVLACSFVSAGFVYVMVSGYIVVCWFCL